MDDLNAKLDALSAKAGQSASIGVHCGSLPVPTMEYVTALVDLHRTGQLIVAPTPTAALQEAVEALDGLISECEAEINSDYCEQEYRDALTHACRVRDRAILRTAAAAGDLIGENDADR